MKEPLIIRLADKMASLADKVDVGFERLMVILFRKWLTPPEDEKNESSDK
jgi:hypothetical protein